VGIYWEDCEKGLIILTLPALDLLSGLEAALAVVAAIIFVPELGHFLAAGIQGLHLTEFAIVFSPTLSNYKGKKVEYALKAFPSERLPEEIKAKLTCDHP
jgi:hypothetical protein